MARGKSRVLPNDPLSTPTTNCSTYARETTRAITIVSAKSPLAEMLLFILKYIVIFLSGIEAPFCALTYGKCAGKCSERRGNKGCSAYNFRFTPGKLVHQPLSLEINLDGNCSQEDVLSIVPSLGLSA